MNINEYCDRLDHVYFQIKKINLRNDMSKLQQYSDLLNESLPKNDAENMARHMIRQLVFANKSKKINLALPSYILLLNGIHITQHFEVTDLISIKWLKSEHKYSVELIADAEDMDSDVFQESPIISKGKWYEN